MGDGTFVDETKGRYGQPYLLPKAVIHLVVRPVTAADAKASAASASAGDAPKKVGKAMGPATAALANFVSDMNLVIHGATKDDGIAAGAASAAGVEGEEYRIPAYYVLIERTIVPDKDSGPFYLHYSPNWFYTEATAVEVSDKHLLKSTTATSSDKTAQVLYNLTDATIELAKASAQIGTGVFASRNRAAPSVSFEPEIAAVQFRELNIDVVFDPLDDTDVERTRDLFADVTVGTTKLVSPFDLRVSTVKRHLWVPGPSGKFPNSPRDAMGCVDPSALPKDDVKRSGIWFREPTGIEVAVRHLLHDTGAAAGPYVTVYTTTRALTAPTPAT